NWPDEPPFRFARFYESRYRELCWDTHGSGNIRRQLHPDLLPMIGAKALFDSARMVVIAACWVVRHLDLWDKPMLARFDEAAGTMARVYEATLKAHEIAPDGDEDSEA